MAYKNEDSMKASLWNKAHPERAKINRDNWKLRHPEKHLECKKQYYWKHRERIIEKRRKIYLLEGGQREQNLKCSYGMTLQDYNRQFQIQGGMCAICGRHQSMFDYSLHVDHNHETGKVRGLLCSGCNMRVGFLEDRKWNESAKKYLEKYNGR